MDPLESEAIYTLLITAVLYIEEDVNISREKGIMRVQM